MAKKPSVNVLLRKHLGKKAADQLIGKIEKMVKAGAGSAKIQQAVLTDLANQIAETYILKLPATGTKIVGDVMVRGLKRGLKK
jgi:hypothetical protein